MFINGQQADSKSISLTPIDVMNASAHDTAILGKGFKGAVDYVQFSYKETAEPQIVYSGSEEPDDSSRIKGDVNADGQFNILDIVLMQKWLLAIPDTHLADWQAGDSYENNKLDAFDLCMMKRALLEKQN